MAEYQNLSQDDIFEIAQKIDGPRDIFQFCQSSTRNRQICQNNYFWWLLLQRDFPQWPMPNSPKNFRSLYLWLNTHRRIFLAENYHIIIRPTTTIDKLFDLVTSYEWEDIENIFDDINLEMNDGTIYNLEWDDNNVRLTRNIDDREGIYPHTTPIGQIMIPEHDSSTNQDYQNIELYEAIKDRQFE